MEGQFIAIGYGNPKSYELLDLEGEASPRVVQLSGCEVEFVRRGAALAASVGAEMIDLNMGCPVPKVVRNNEGSALMRQPELAEQVIAFCVMVALSVAMQKLGGLVKIFKKKT